MITLKKFLDYFEKEENNMLWTILVILFILWLLGFLGGNVWNNGTPYGGDWVHTLLVIIVILVITHLLFGIP